MNRSLIWIGAAVGSTAGGLLPLVWHVSAFSFTSVFFSALGGIGGIIVAYKITKNYL